MESKLFLKENPTLKDFQDYIMAALKERGFEEETLPEVFYYLLKSVESWQRLSGKIRV